MPSVNRPHQPMIGRLMAPETCAEMVRSSNSGRIGCLRDHLGNVVWRDDPILTPFGVWAWLEGWRMVRDRRGV